MLGGRRTANTDRKLLSWLLLRYFNHLGIVVVDFESEALGQGAVVGPLLRQMATELTNSNTEPRLGISVRNGSSYPGGVDQVRYDVSRIYLTDRASLTVCE